MNNEHKQRMTHELGQWNAAMKSSCSVSDLLAISTRMAALLQELIDAPEPEQPNQSEQHLEMVNAPAPSVPDGWKNAAEWLRNNYQDYPNISSLCDAMVAQSANNGSN